MSTQAPCDVSVFVPLSGRQRRVFLMHLSSHHAVFLEIYGAASISLHSYTVHSHPHILSQASEPAVLCGPGSHRLCCQLQHQRPDEAEPADAGGLSPSHLAILLPPRLQCQQENPHPYSGHHTQWLLLCRSTVQSASRG